MNTTAARPERAAIPILLVAAFVVILNETTMNVAVSHIMTDFGIGERTAQWLITAFLLTSAVIIPITGWMLDRFTTRRVFLTALGLFSTGTLLGALAPTFLVLLLARVVQASGTAMMMPLLMTTIMRMVEPNHRGRIMGRVSMVISVAPAIGPTLSGFVLEVASWRAIFLVVLPIALLMWVLGFLKLPDVGEPSSAPLDFASIPLSALAFGPLIYGLSLIGADDVAFWVPMLSIGVGLGALLAFVARQLVLQGRNQAFLDLRTFTHGAFIVAVAMLALTKMALMGTIVLIPLILQRAFGMDALHVGLILLPGGVLMGVLAPVIGRIFDRRGPRVLVLPAAILVMGCFLGLAFLTLGTPWWVVMGINIVMSVCFASIFTPLFTVALGALPRKLYSHGSAVVGTLQQVAGAAGTALFVTIFAMQSQASTASALPERLLEGSHWAFLGAGAVWTGAVIAACFIRRADSQD